MTTEKRSQDKLLADCMRYCELTGEKFSSMCRKATKDGRTPERLGGSGSVSLDKMDALYEYMNQRCPAIVNPMLGE